MSRVLVVVERFFPEDFLVNDLVAEWVRQGDSVEVLTQVPSYPFDRIFDGYRNLRLQTTVEKIPVGCAGGGAEGAVRFICEVPVHRVNTIFGYNRSVKRKILNYLHFGWRTFWWCVWHGRKYDRIFVYHTAALTMAMGVYPLKFVWRKSIDIWTQDLWPDAVWGFGFRRNVVCECLLNWFVRSIYGSCDRIMVSCRGYVARIYELTGREAEFVPQWEPNKIRLIAEKQKEAGRRPMVFMFAGNLGKPQNLEKDIEGFLKADLKDAELWVVGGGVMLDELKAKYAKIVAVKFWGRQPRNEMPKWFAQADALIISLTEAYQLTLPGKFQSYIQTGKPLVGLLLGDAKEMIEEYNLGVTAKPNDVTGIAAAFRKMAEMIQGGEGGECGRRALELSRRMFDRNNLIQRLRGGS